jgi:hypothetical protein
VLINCLKEAMVRGMIAEGLLGNRRNPGSYFAATKQEAVEK